MEILEFIFTNFWTFIGTFLLLNLILNGIIYIFKTILRIPTLELSDKQIDELTDKIAKKLKEDKNVEQSRR